MLVVLYVLYVFKHNASIIGTLENPTTGALVLHCWLG